jgi:5'-nucleotidase (lipoprotein e(P4) family)
MSHRLIVEPAGRVRPEQRAGSAPPQLGLKGRVMTSRAFGLLLLLVVSPACRSAAGAGRPPQTTGAAPAGAATSNSDPESIRWVRDSAEYRALCVQVFRRATAHIETESSTRPAGSWAVILDADETVISNATYQLERARLALPFTQASWTAWVRRREATPLPGAPQFLNRVHALGGRIAIVTNRLESECADTAAVFAAHALAYDAMLCRPDGGSGDKNPRFEAVASGRTPAGAGRLEVVAYIGDNVLDFPALNQSIKTAGDEAFAEFGVHFFVLPNPMYGSWQ